MSIDMTSNFMRLLAHFRRHDLSAFNNEHARLFAVAKQTGDHSEVTAHYYSVMSRVIDDYFNGNFHFVPPLEKGQRLEEALNALHRRIATELGLKDGVKCVDVGCGIGTVMQEVAYTGADLTGVTIAANEVEIGNDNFARLGLNDKCRLIEADCHKMPFDDETFDCAYAIYALKYFVDLKPVLKEISRVLKPGGKFVVYDLVKTDKYDDTNEKHKSIVEGLEYACGMPSLHRRSEIIEECAAAGLDLSSSVDLSAETGLPYHYCFSHSASFMWMVRSTLLSNLIKLCQFVKILPQGFSRFCSTFLRGTISKIVAGGQLGILDGAEILVFEKCSAEISQ